MITQLCNLIFQTKMSSTFTLARNLLQIPKRSYSQNVTQELIFKYLQGTHKGIAVCELNRPKQKNAFSRNLVRELHQTLDQISFENEARVLVLRSLVPGVFCSGIFC